MEKLLLRLKDISTEIERYKQEKCSKNREECKKCDLYEHGYCLLGDYKEVTDTFVDILESTKIDWYKVPVDTPVLVKDRIEDEWQNQYFAGYNGRVLTFMNGTTSWSGNGSKQAWRFAKLVKEEQDEDTKE